MHNDAQIAEGGFRPTTTRADSTAVDGTLIDRYGRRITYIRLSVTDRCDFRCAYCMPMDAVFLPKREVLSLEECLRIARVFAGLGAHKIRVTGGEPLVRRNVLWLLKEISALDGISELTMTTNGSQLSKTAESLVCAGVSRLNISLDTLRPDRFRALTRTGELHKVLDGIAAAVAAGFREIKLNAVMMRGVNDDELIDLVNFAAARDIHISFIEEMPLGDVGRFRADTYISSDEAMKILRDEFTLEKSPHQSGGPARYWNLIGTKTRVGFISPHSHNFCESCNRVRINCVGELFPCLGQNEFINLKPSLADGDDAVRGLIMEAMEIKPKGHDFNIYQSSAKVVRFMSATGG